MTQDKNTLWKTYGPLLKSILNHYKKGQTVQLHDNGLLLVHEKQEAVRSGYLVEICALWYNAVCFALELSQDKEEDAFEAEFGYLPALIKENFLPTFWCEARSHLADFFNYKELNVDTRHNQLFACSLPYTPLSDETIHRVLEACRKELLTTRGIRTLSPKNPLYKGRHEGTQEEEKSFSERFYGTLVVGTLFECKFRLHGKFRPFSQRDYTGFRRRFNRTWCRISCGTV